MKKSKTWIKKFAKKNNSQMKINRKGGGMKFTKAKMRIVLKITEIPKAFEIVKNGWYKFILDDGDQKVSITIRPKMWNKFIKADSEFPEWVAQISGKFGKYQQGMLFLESPIIEVFKKKPKK